MWASGFVMNAERFFNTVQFTVPHCKLWSALRNQIDKKPFFYEEIKLVIDFVYEVVLEGGGGGGGMTQQLLVT